MICRSTRPNSWRSVRWSVICVEELFQHKLGTDAEIGGFRILVTAAGQWLGLGAASVRKAYWNNTKDTSGIVLDNDLARAVLDMDAMGLAGLK